MCSVFSEPIESPLSLVCQLPHCSRSLRTTTLPFVSHYHSSYHLPILSHTYFVPCLNHFSHYFNLLADFLCTSLPLDYLKNLQGLHIKSKDYIRYLNSVVSGNSLLSSTSKVMFIAFVSLLAHKFI